VAESIFTSQTPAVANANDGASTLGTVFTVATAGTVDGCRWFTPSTLPTGGQVQAILYQWTSDTTGTVLAQVNFNPTTPAAWNTVNYGSPISVVPGQRYVTAVFTPNQYAYTNDFFTSSGVTNGNLTAPQNDNATPAHNGKFIQQGFPSYPNQSFRDSCYFVDVLFTASGGPTGSQLIVVTGTGETDSAQGVAVVLATLTRAITGAFETDSAQSISVRAGAVTGAIGVASETDSAQAITVNAGTQAVTVTGAGETDVGLVVTPRATFSATIGLATETDAAQSITVVNDQVIGIGTAGETDSAQAITARSSGVGTSFNSTGPCSPLDDWQPIWCGPLSPAAMAVTGEAVQMAADVLWIATGQRFGRCTTKLRPCREECNKGWFGWDQWWPGVGSGIRTSTGGGPRPWWYNGVWYNICGTCAGSCSCTLIDEALLPAPTREVIEVKLDDLVMDPSRYRVDENRKLVRIDGQLWPMCQDMAADDDQPGTWSVTISVGEDVPLLARRAVGQLAAEFAKDCADEGCELPFEITSLSRQGLNMQFNTSETNELLNTIALRWVNLFVNTYNPNGLKHRAKVYDVDRNPRPWRRVDTI